MDTFLSFVWEPSLVKVNAITAATEATCLILSVDETVRNPASAPPEGQAAANAMAGGWGGGVQAAANTIASGRGRIGGGDRVEFGGKGGGREEGGAKQSIEQLHAHLLCEGAPAVCEGGAPVVCEGRALLCVKEEHLFTSCRPRPPRGTSTECKVMTMTLTLIWIWISAHAWILCGPTWIRAACRIKWIRIWPAAGVAAAVWACFPGPLHD